MQLNKMVVPLIAALTLGLGAVPASHAAKVDGSANRPGGACKTPHGVSVPSGSSHTEFDIDGSSSTFVCKKNGQLCDTHHNADGSVLDSGCTKAARHAGAKTRATTGGSANAKR